MTRKTSVEAFEKIKASGLLKGLRLKVYSVLYESGPMTASEAAELIPDHRINSINPRFAELAARRTIAVTGERICRITKMKALEWDVTGSLPEKPEASKPKNKVEMLRRHNEEMKKEIARLEAIVASQRRQLNKWGRPSKAEQTERADTSLKLPI